MKRFLRKIAPFLLFILILEIAIPMAVDPYNVFHWQKIRDNGVEPNSNYIKMQYILHNPDKFDSFLFARPGPASSTWRKFRRESGIICPTQRDFLQSIWRICGS